MEKGWTAKRLVIDLNLERAWTEDISSQDLAPGAGGRSLNAKYFLEQVSPSEFPIALSVGPLAGTLAPCSGWTSIAFSSMLTEPPRYAHLSMPGHWGPQLKFAGFDQCILRGKGSRPLYLWIDGDKVRFEDATHLWGKDTVETTVTIQEEKEDRDAEVLCIGPAGERGVRFANVVNRCSWTGDHVGLGHAFGQRKVKAIAIRGHHPVVLHRPEPFLDRCLALRDRINRDQEGSALREEGTFFFLGKNGAGLGIKNYNEVSSPRLEENWKNLYAAGFLYGREGCFSCPIHCGRVTQMDQVYFGGVHLEGAWSLGPSIGIHDWESTLRLYRICQLKGIDASAMGSLLSWIMDGFETRLFSAQDLDSIECRWGDGDAAHRLIEAVVEGRGAGEIFRLGPLGAALKLGKGRDLVAHSHGMNLPVRDPRSSQDYAAHVSLFPSEWDYLRSYPEPDPSTTGEIAERVLKAEELKILADNTSLCALVTAHLRLISPSDIAELTAAATGMDSHPSTLIEEVQKTFEMEKALLARTGNSDKALPRRLFAGQRSHDPLEGEVSSYQP